MLESFSLLLIILSALFTVLTVEKKRIEYNMLSILFWILSMSSVILVEIPYALLDNAGNIATGTFPVYTQAPLALAFFGMAIIMVLYAITEVWRE